MRVVRSTDLQGSCAQVPRRKKWMGWLLLLTLALVTFHEPGSSQFTSTRLTRPWSSVVPTERVNKQGTALLTECKVEVVKPADYSKYWHDINVKLVAANTKSAESGLAEVTTNVVLSKDWVAPEDGIYDVVFLYTYRASCSLSYTREPKGGEWAVGSAKLTYGVSLGPSGPVVAGNHTLISEGITCGPVDPKLIPLDAIAQEVTKAALGALGLSGIAAPVSKVVGQVIGPMKVYSTKERIEEFRVGEGQNWAAATTDRNLRVPLRKGQAITLFAGTLVGVSARGRSTSKANATLEIMSKLNWIEVTKVGPLPVGGENLVVAERLLAKDIPGGPSYRPLVEAAYRWEAGKQCSRFLASDERVVSWIRFQSITGQALVQWNWYSPDGNLYWSYTTVVPDPLTGDRAWSWIGIKDRGASVKRGEWRVEVWWESSTGKTKLTEQFFTVE